MTVYGCCVRVIEFSAHGTCHSHTAENIDLLSAHQSVNSLIRLNRFLKKPADTNRRRKSNHLWSDEVRRQWPAARSSMMLGTLPYRCWLVWSATKLTSYCSTPSTTASFLLVKEGQRFIKSSSPRRERDRLDDLKHLDIPGLFLLIWLLHALPGRLETLKKKIFTGSADIFYYLLRV